MKKISKRAWMAMALAMALLAGLLIFVGSYFVNAKTWVTFPGSPHVYTGVNPDCGRIYDRSGMLLLNTDDGRVYKSSGWQCLQYTHVPFVSFGVRVAMTE